MNVNRKLILIVFLTLPILLFSGCQRETSQSPEMKNIEQPPLHQSEIISPKENPNETKEQIAKEQKAIEQSVSVKKSVSIIPTQVWIPSVGIKAPVEPVGLLENGQMEAPVSSKVAGVLTDGVLPGQIGSAIIAGHVDNYTGPAIFYPLKKLKPGQPVVLSDDEGNYLVFKVLAVESYLTAEAPVDKIFGDTDMERLNLITCTGKYNREKREHEKRLVVYTRLLK